jgi:hypothetical protein
LSFPHPFITEYIKYFCCEIIASQNSSQAKTNFMKRIILSVLAGVVATGIVSTLADFALHAAGLYPPYGQPMYDTPRLLLAFIYRALFAIGGAYLTAIIAKDRYRKSVIIVGIVGSILWLLGAIALWDLAAPWYNVSGVIFGVPFALIGGKLYENRQRKLTHLAS